MTNAGILTWMLPLIGIRSTFAHHEIMETVELFRVLGNSYRLACSRQVLLRVTSGHFAVS